jgi:GTP-binding protein Era
VGKSTLFNALVGRKVSIVSPKPQTTRHRILGIRTEGSRQWVFVDTPGLHGSTGKALNRHLNRTATASLADVDLVLLMVEAHQWTDADDAVLDRIRRAGAPVALILNKVDRLAQREDVLPRIESVSKKADFVFVVPLSARRRENLEALLEASTAYLPEGPLLFPKAQYTDRNERFLAAETVREKLTIALQQELPYALTVSVEDFQRSRGTAHIHATIWVARRSQKAIVIGRGGEVLKKVGQQARRELESRWNEKVFIRLWVKVREGWLDDEKALRSLGFDQEL